MLPKLPLVILEAEAVRSTTPLVPSVPLAVSEPCMLSPLPLRVTLPVVAVIDELPLELRAPVASASKLPAAVALEPVKFNALELLRNTPSAAFAVTFATDILRRPLGPVPMVLVPEV